MCQTGDGPISGHPVAFSTPSIAIQSGSGSAFVHHMQILRIEIRDIDIFNLSIDNLYIGIYHQWCQVHGRTKSRTGKRSA
jgi:hypothetical protein